MSSTKSGRLISKHTLLALAGRDQDEAAPRLVASEGASVIGTDLMEDAADAMPDAVREEYCHAPGPTVRLSDSGQVGTSWPLSPHHRPTACTCTRPI